MTGKFILRKDSSPNEFGEYQVNLQYCTFGVPLKKATGIAVKPEHWLGDDGRSTKFIKTGKEGHPKAEMLNRRLLNQKKTIDDIIDKLLVNKGDVISVPVLRSILNGTYKEREEAERGKVDFVQFVLEHNYNQYLEGKIGYSVWDNIQCYMNKFSQFLQKTKRLNTRQDNILYCKEVDAELIKEYILWRKENKNKNATINKALTPIVKAVKECCRKGWLDRDVYDDIYRLYLPNDGKSLDEAESGVEALNVEQLKRLKDLAAESKYDRTRDFVDIFMFSVCACGLRVSDICTLKWSEVDMENRTIKHLQVKNHNRKAVWLNIPFNDMGLEILERWKGRNEKYVFGLLADDFDLGNEAELKYAVASQNRTINQSLNCMGKKMGLPFSLHMHIARHTFATISLNEGMDIKSISTLMGHTSVMTTEKVYAAYLPNTLRESYNARFNLQI